jgi:hypothetical protein
MDKNLTDLRGFTGFADSNQYSKFPSSFSVKDRKNPGQASDGIHRLSKELQSRVSAWLRIEAQANLSRRSKGFSAAR